MPGQSVVMAQLQDQEHREGHHRRGGGSPSAASGVLSLSLRDTCDALLSGFGHGLGRSSAQLRARCATRNFPRSGRDESPGRT
jgi:hypothetical protein